MIDLVNNLKEQSHQIDILYVEDDKEVALALVGILKKIFLNVDVAFDGEEGLAYYSAKSYDIVISDIAMPIMNGIEMIKAIKLINPSQKIIVTSAHNDVHYLQELINLNILHFIQKPIDLKLMFNTLEKISQTIIQEKSVISDRENFDNKFEEQEFYFKSVIDGVDEPVMVISKEYEVLLMNESAKVNMITEWVADVRHPKCYEVSHHRNTPCSGEEHPCPLDSIINDQKPVKVQHIHDNSKGEKCLVELSAKPAFNALNQFIGIIETTRDITQKVATEKELIQKTQEIEQYQITDSVTKLPNKTSFVQEHEKLLKSIQNQDAKNAVIVLNIDDFKNINNSYGSEVGDIVLQSIAKKLIDNYADKALVASLGVDSFVIALKEMNNTKNVDKTVKQIIDIIKIPIIVDKHTIYIGCNVGVSCHKKDGNNTQTLLANAEMAMFFARKDTNTNYSYYDSSMHEIAHDEALLDTYMHKAIELDEFIVHYQPQVDSRNGMIIGAEALVRWKHPVLGLLSPSVFLPLAEKNGLLVEIDRLIIYKAFKATRKWHDMGLAFDSISVNITAGHLLSDDFLEVFNTLLKKTKCKPEWVFVEITEGTMMSNPSEAVNRLNKLKKLGIRVAIDDFGTGYSSLSHLKTFPVDKLKIDRVFIKDLPQNSEDISIVNAIMSLAKSLNLSTIAEGVETVEQREHMRSVGNYDIQGYFYSPPVEESKFEVFLQRKYFKINDEISDTVII